MWIKDNITRIDKDIWYEAKLIEKIKKICNEALYIATKTDNLGSYNEILAIIQENEK